MPNIICISPIWPEFAVFSIDVDTFKEANVKFVQQHSIIDTLSEISLQDVESVLFAFDGFERLPLHEKHYQSKLAKKVEDYLKQHSLNEIPLHCCLWDSIVTSATLMAIVDEHGEDVLVDDMEFIYCIDRDEYRNNNILKRENYFYINSFHRNFLCYGEQPFQCLKARKAFITCLMLHPSQSLTPEQKELQKQIIKYLPKNNYVILTANAEKYLNEAIVAKVLHLIDKKALKYNVANTGFKDYGIGFQDSRKMRREKAGQTEKLLIKIGSNEIVPVKKSFVCYERFNPITFFESASFALRGVSKFSVDDIPTTVTLSVDKYFMPHVEVENSKKDMELGAMITLHENKFFVEVLKNGKNICLYNNIPLMIAFVEGGVQIGREAVKLKDELNTFVIFDLMKITKAEPTKLQAAPKWGFSLIKDKKNQILLEFDTFRGRRKATPSFLTAFFIRWAIKNVELICNEMPKTIVIVTRDLDDRVRKHLMESCKHAKLQLCTVQVHQCKIVEIK